MSLLNKYKRRIFGWKKPSETKTLKKWGTAQYKYAQQQDRWAHDCAERAYKASFEIAQLHTENVSLKADLKQLLEANKND